ncbi:multimerin-1 [Perognathus longimembris pacificus]|uniref:multimerin-1 n=1 Tax=Perognathus longimembris pacificus TaxID=214514 RepID=UPI002018A849|nr:multimerin-1 [Perognathus longimembris pacificus]
MKGAKLFVLLSSLWSAGIGLNDTTHSWTTPEDENSQENVTSLTQMQSLQRFSAIQNTLTEETTAPEVQPSARPPSEASTPEAVRNPTLTPTGKTGEVVKLQSLAVPSKPSIKLSPGAESVVLSNATLTFLQSFARKPDPQAISPKSEEGVGNRSPRETYLSRGDSNGSQRPSYQKSSFETTRGKNWCAYVHTRLSPTAILDNQVNYIPSGREPCGWISGCPQRSQKILSPVYRMQHKIVTSLEWRCCPGYSGPKCQSKAQEQQQVIHSSQSESHTALDRGNAERLQQQPDCGDPAVIQKLTDQVTQEATKLTLLQKKVDNISSTINNVKSTYSSLEEKISEDKGREFQSFLKGLKSKSITDLVRDIVREQLKVFKNDMQETVAQLFKTVSSLSEDLENTRHVIQQVNESVVSLAIQQKSVLMQDDRPTWTDIVDLKNRMVNVRQEMTFVCEKPIKELEAKQTHLEEALTQEHSRSILYYESLKNTLSKVKEAQEQFLSTKEGSEQKNVAAAESVSSNVTTHMTGLHEKINKQALMMLQMSDDLHIQESKINNLTLSLELQKISVKGACEEMLATCRHDFKFQLRDTEENLQVLNQTLAEVVFPMDSKIEQMNEQVNDLTRDMEMLQPLLEQEALLQRVATPEQPKEAVLMRKKVESLVSAINSLNSLLKELTKRHNLLRNEVQTRGASFERRLGEFAMEMEDGLNKTMTIINNAIDSVQDNYVRKETLHTEYNLKVHHSCGENMETILAFISQFQRLNDSIQILINDDQRYNFVLQVAKALADMPKDQDDNQSSFQKIYHMFNEIISQVKKYQQNITHLEENFISATNISKKFETRLQSMESKVTQTLIPYYISLKKSGSMATDERDQALQLQVLNSRFKALEAKSIRLSVGFSLLNKTVQEFLTMCRNASADVSELNATLPKWMKGLLPDSQLSQKGLMELVDSIIEIKTQAALSNLTWYVDRLWSDGLANVKSQKQVKLQKKPNVLKKPAVNLTTIVIGRTQRNTDSLIYPVTQESSGCSRFPCLNGGTCISGVSSFTCACRHPFTGENCTVKVEDKNALAPDFSKGSYRYAPMVAFFASRRNEMTTPGPILFNELDVNYGASYNPRTGKFIIPYLGVYVFRYTIESSSAHISGFLVVDGVDKLTFESENINSEIHCDRVLTGDALLELNYGQEVWLRLVKGTIPAKFPPVTTFSGYLLYRT